MPRLGVDPTTSASPQQILADLQSGRLDPRIARARYWALTGKDLPTSPAAGPAPGSTMSRQPRPEVSGMGLDTAGSGPPQEPPGFFDKLMVGNAFMTDDEYTDAYREQMAAIYRRSTPDGTNLERMPAPPYGEPLVGLDASANPMKPPVEPATSPAPAPGPRAPAEPPMPMPRPAPPAAQAEPAPSPDQGLAGMMLSAPEPDSKSLAMMAAKTPVEAAATGRAVDDAREAGSPEWAIPLILAGLSTITNSRKGLIPALAEGGLAGLSGLLSGRKEKKQDERLAKADALDERRTRATERQGDLASRQLDASIASTAATRAATKAQQDRAYELQGRVLDETERYHTGVLNKPAAGRQPRAPTRLEETINLASQLKEAGVPNPEAAAAGMIKDIYGGGKGGKGADPLDKLVYSMEFQQLEPEEQNKILRRLGQPAPPSPTDQFYQTPPPVPVNPLE